MEVTNVILSGIVGSTAYGLDTEDSDTDRLGLFAADTIRILGLHPPSDSVVHTSPDITFHEAGKYIRLALKCNPTITELMWLPMGPPYLYEVISDFGEELSGIRETFLSRSYVRNAYLGYAEQQFRRLKERGDGSFSSDTRKRTAKHARHLLRLLTQGLELYETGKLTVRLEHPEHYRSFGEKVAAGDLEIVQRELDEAENCFDSVKSPLPEQADEKPAEDWLLRVRRFYYS
jgi:uncharacterized protein